MARSGSAHRRTCWTRSCCRSTSRTPAARRTPSRTRCSTASRSMPDKMFADYSAIADRVAPFVADTALLLNRAIANGEVGDVRGRARHHARHRSWNVSVRDLVERNFRRRGDRNRRSSNVHQHCHRRDQGLLHARGRRTVSHRIQRRHRRGAAQERQRVRRGHGTSASHRLARSAAAALLQHDQRHRVGWW